MLKNLLERFYNLGVGVFFLALCVTAYYVFQSHPEWGSLVDILAADVGWWQGVRIRTFQAFIAMSGLFGLFCVISAMLPRGVHDQLFRLTP